MKVKEPEVGVDIKDVLTEPRKELKIENHIGDQDQQSEEEKNLEEEKQVNDTTVLDEVISCYLLSVLQSFWLIDCKSFLLWVFKVLTN